MGCRRLRFPIFLAALSLVLFGLGCIFGTDEEPPPGVPPPEIPPPTSTENIVKALEVIYTDKVRSATERKLAYENLLASPPGCQDPDSCRAFLFDFQPADEEQGTPDTWGRDSEVASAENIFLAQENGGIHELTLTIESLPEEPINEAGKEGWTEVFATSVHLRLLTTPQDGFEVLGGQAQFQAYPYDGRWWLGEWIDLPRP